RSSEDRRSRRAPSGRKRQSRRVTNPEAGSSAKQRVWEGMSNEPLRETFKGAWDGGGGVHSGGWSRYRRFPGAPASRSARRAEEEDPPKSRPSAWPEAVRHEHDGRAAGIPRAAEVERSPRRRRDAAFGSRPQPIDQRDDRRHPRLRAARAVPSR